VVVSAIDRDHGQRLTMEASYPLAQSVSELSEIVDQLDALVIATPPQTHYGLALDALNTGLHVMVEKPFTTTEAHGLELIALADTKDLRLMVGHTFEFNPAVWALKDLIASPEFGQVRYINSARLNLGLYQPDVDVTWDLAPHDISIINFILGSSPTSVHAWGLNLMGERADVAYIGLRYDELDVSAKIHVSWLDPMKVRRTTVVGENAMAVYDDVAEERIRIYDKGVKAEGISDNSGGYPLSYRNGAITSPYVAFEEPLKLELANFVQSIRTGANPASDGRNGLDVVRVLIAADESQRTGRWVDVNRHETIDLRDHALSLIDGRAS
jgi:predicted dehydrogenase